MSLIDYPVKASETAKVKVVLSEAPKEEAAPAADDKDDGDDGEEFEPFSPLDPPPKSASTSDKKSSAV